MATQQYSAGAFGWITTEKTAIQNTAQAIGVSATAIAGAMAKERTLYDLTRVVNYTQDALMQTYTNFEAGKDYSAPSTRCGTNSRCGRMPTATAQPMPGK